jgi:hypothetical protein
MTHGLPEVEFPVGPALRDRNPVPVRSAVSGFKSLKLLEKALIAP